MLTGGCRCGAVRYQADTAETENHVLCHCGDCRRSAGAPVVAWLAVPLDRFAIVEGKPARWDGNGGAERYFCATCGTSLYYLNGKVIPGTCDIQSATLDGPGELAPGIQIQCAERLPYMTRLGEIFEIERFPAGIVFD